jgi:mannose/fructose/N-acetylgalactosamine-specific phosphotransferase system component IID
MIPMMYNVKSMRLPIFWNEIPAKNLRVILAIFVSGLLLNSVLWLVALFFFPRQEQSTVLHYSSSVGIDFVGEGERILVLPISGLALLIGNFVLGAVIYRADYRAAWVLWGMIPLIQMILLGAFYLLWRVNS